MNFYALTGLILFLSKFNPIMHCFLLIFCGDTSGTIPIMLNNGHNLRGKRSDQDTVFESRPVFSGFKKRQLLGQGFV
jgi:hypothetical protein